VGSTLRLHRRRRASGRGSRGGIELAARFALSGDAAFKEWGCSECKGKKFKAQDFKRASRNCDGKHPDDGKTLGFVWAPELKRCPWSVVPPDAPAWSFVRMWEDWKLLGLLPDEGDIGAQRPIVVEALRRCELARAERDERERKKAEEEARKGSKTKEGR
jgi:hypothetical protein